MQFFNACKQWMKDAGLPTKGGVGTARGIHPEGAREDAAKAVLAGHSIFLIDIERGTPLKRRAAKWLQEKGQDDLTDQQLLAAAAVVAEKLRSHQPGLRIGAWIEGRVAPGPWIDDLQGVETVNGTSQGGLPMSVDFVSINAFHHGRQTLEKNLSWKVTLIKKFRLHIRCQLYAHVETTWFEDSVAGDGKQGELRSYDDLNRIIDVIHKDVNGIVWADFRGNKQPYDPSMPWVRVTEAWS